MAKLYRGHYRNYNPTGGHEHYIKKYFEYTAYCKSRFDSVNTNMLTRLQSALAMGLNSSKHGTFPKYIVVLLDNDLISHLNCKSSDGVDVLYGSWITWLIAQFESLIKVRSNQLPVKTKKITPFFY